MGSPTHNGEQQHTEESTTKNGEEQQHNSGGCRRKGSITLQDKVLQRLRSELELEEGEEHDGGSVKQQHHHHTTTNHTRKTIISDEPTGLQVWRILYEAVDRDSLPDTPHQVKLQRTTFLTYLCVTLVTSMGGTIVCAIHGEAMATTLGLFYTFVAGVCIKATLRYNLYRYATLLFMCELVEPFLLQFFVGGIVKSGAVMIWSMIAPVGVALVISPKAAKPYFYFYEILVVVTCLVEYYGIGMDSNKQLQTLDLVLFGMHHGFLGAAVFYASSVFATKFSNEHALSENLLVNLFPTSIANRLKSGENPIVDNHDSVTILFCNFVGFNHATSCMNPKFLVGTVLRDVCTAFDYIVDHRGLEKIKTTGDIYMAVGGLHRNKDSGLSREEQEARDAHEVTCVAFEFQDILQEIYARYGISLQVRIGIHTGPVIAGVLGVKRFAFDVWGDAVNTASRMESTGLPGKVHVTMDTYQRIKGFQHLECMPCQAAEVKGKGVMQTYMVTLRRHSDSHDIPFGTAKTPVTKIVKQLNEKGGGGTTIVQKSPLELELESPIDESPFDNPNVARRRDSLWYYMATFMSPPEIPPSAMVKRETSVVFWVISVIVSCAFLPVTWMYGEFGALLIVDAYITSTVIVGLISAKFKTFQMFETFYIVSMYLINITLPTFFHGGVRAYGSGIIWLFMLPLGSALVHSPLQAQRWFVVYLVSTIFCHMLDASYREGLVSTWEIVLFAWNNIGACTIIFTVVHLYATELTKEHSYSESLLLNALPIPVAKRLRSGENPIVDYLDGTSILLADLVGFTKASSIADPQFLVGQFLRDIFFEFDKLIEKRQVEKIKTIGDAIMVVAGLQGGNTSKHTMQLVLLATELHQKLAQVNARYGTNFGLRIGVHTGPIIAGVLGAKRFRYDVWGDSVGMAGELESKCVPGLVHISASTYDAIKEHEHLFDFRDGGGLAIEEHIKMKTYLVRKRVKGKQSPQKQKTEAEATAETKKEQ